jgi:hypothetical protein
VSEIPDGLYSLRLVVTEGSGNLRTAVIPVIVDNTPPEVEIIHPLDGAVYILESDEWVNIQVEALDSYAMEHLEFFLDGQAIGLTTIAPFTHKWTIALSDTAPSLISDPAVISHTETITIGEEYLVQAQTLIDGTMITVTSSITPSQVLTTTAMYTSGLGFVADTGGYTETHLIHVVGYDAAGNQTESEKVRIFTIHKPEEPEPTPAPLALLLPTAADPPVASDIEQERLALSVAPAQLSGSVRTSWQWPYPFRAGTGYAWLPCVASGGDDSALWSLAWH